MAEQVVEQENSVHKPAESGAGSGFFGGIISGIMGSSASAAASSERKNEEVGDAANPLPAAAAVEGFSSSRKSEVEDRSGSSQNSRALGHRESKGDGSSSSSKKGLGLGALLSSRPRDN